jgi:pyruvate carboxylase
LLFPGPTSDFETSREKFGNLSVLGTIEFLHGIEPGTEYEVEIEAGKRLLLGVQSIGEVDGKGMRTVMCTLNGQFRPIKCAPRPRWRSRRPRRPTARITGRSRRLSRGS